MQVSSAGVSDIGRVRARNEDRYVAEDRLVAVADGMGGHLAGDLAAQAMVDAVAGRSWAVQSAEQVETLLQECVDEAQEAISGVVASSAKESAARTQVHPGSGTTLAGAVYVPSSRQWHVFHVGDSRVYLFRERCLTRLTSDHSFVQELVDTGAISEEEARVHPKRSVVTRAIGSHGGARCDVAIHPALAGDIIFACSDGLSDELGDEEIEAVIVSILDSGEENDAESIVFGLRDVAISRGGHDNVTISLMMIGEEE